ncbi:MAG: glycosyltransferase [Terriglobia bacterium]|jgi:processive 1,2-diacylglycerol beta-glucosyltransferase
MLESADIQRPRVLILTLHHGSTHVRISRALEKALLHLRPNLKVVVVDALAHCEPWFRAYYNSYEIPLKYWPGLWDYIERHEYEGETSGPWWLYRWGARPLFRYIEAFAPDVVAATEVGLGEIAVIHKRAFGAQYFLVGIETFAYERAWAQPEVDLFISHPGEVAAQIRSLGVPPQRILECGVPVDPAFSLCPNRSALRARLGLRHDLPVLLVNFGGSGKNKPREVVSELRNVQHPFQVVFISRRDESLRKELLRLSAEMAHARVLRWVDNMHEWMAAADLLVSRAGGGIVAESLNSGLPLLVFDPHPGNERRFCQLIEECWHTGYWAKRPGLLATLIDHLLRHPEEREQLRNNALRHAYPDASRIAAEAILHLREKPEDQGGSGPS